MIVGPVDLKAFAGAAGLPAANTVAGSANPAVSFASVLSDMATNTVGTLQRAEQVSVQGMQGQVDTREVVDAVMNAEQALQAAVAIRDKIISAYMEISRMAI
jgi:flagellar hook-basal body complex protein FliE